MADHQRGRLEVAGARDGRQARRLHEVDVDVKGGLTVGIGKAGNPNVMNGVDPALDVGNCTDLGGAEGRMVTTGVVDTQIHLVTPSKPQQAYKSIISGVTLLRNETSHSAGSGHGLHAQPSPVYVRQMLQARDKLPVTWASRPGKRQRPSRPPGTGGGRRLRPPAARGLGHDSDRHRTCWAVCDEMDMQWLIHTDTLNESGFVVPRRPVEAGVRKLLPSGVRRPSVTGLKACRARKRPWP